MEFIGDPRVAPCWECYEWHKAALEVLAGKPPPGCQGCGRTWQQLRDQTPGEDVRMCLHPKDGVLQLLCGRCSDAYERKRLDMYAGTPHGWLKKLAGAK
ncbi:MAG: hypothetical protein HXY24_10850 [Rubrivivax sp.]|nr:hypothetical protein [Rubrivivax sp.]